MTDQRKLTAQRVRQDAIDLAARRDHPQHQANGDEQRYESANYPMSFTKGLDHNTTTGLVEQSGDFKAFRYAIDNGLAEDFTRHIAVPRAEPRRKWEAPTAGTFYELQGPDPQAVTIPPAPDLCSEELTFEMAEVYELALLGDLPFNAFDAGGGSAALADSADRLNDSTVLPMPRAASTAVRAPPTAAINSTRKRSFEVPVRELFKVLTSRNSCSSAMPVRVGASRQIKASSTSVPRGSTSACWR